MYLDFFLNLIKTEIFIKKSKLSQIFCSVSFNFVSFATEISGLTNGIADVYETPFPRMQKLRKQA